MPMPFSKSNTYRPLAKDLDFVDSTLSLQSSCGRQSSLGSSILSNGSHEKMSRSIPICHGLVLLDDDDDAFAPQVMTEDNYSPVYSDIYDEYGNPMTVYESNDSQFDLYIPKVRHFHRSCQTPDDFDHLDKEDDDFLQRSQGVWSDCGIPLRTSYEFWKSKVNSLDRQDGKKDFKNIVPKYASESNIEDALVMLEPGLRKIPKQLSYTTDEENSPIGSNREEQAFHFDHFEPEPALHSSAEMTLIALNEESGFFSFTSSNPNPSNSKHVTLIPINQDPILNSFEDGIVTATGTPAHFLVSGVVLRCE